MKRISALRIRHESALAHLAGTGAFRPAHADSPAAGFWPAREALPAGTSRVHSLSQQPGMTSWDDCQLWPDCIE
jgi:hypothetical protein